jgi:hypothetical protein
MPGSSLEEALIRSDKDLCSKSKAEFLETD